MLKKLKFLIVCAFVVCAAMPATAYAESFTTQNAAIETITQHTLTFNPNCTDDSYFISESSIDIPESDKYGTLPIPSRKGYKFLGWYTASDGGNKVSESTVMGSSDAVVYAYWAAYTITINYMTDGEKLGVIIQKKFQMIVRNKKSHSPKPWDMMKHILMQILEC